MSVNALITQFETEISDIRAKMDSMKERSEFLDSLLKELRGASKSSKPRAGKAPAAKKSGGKKKVDGRKKGAVTVKDGILAAVSSSAEALTAGEIIAEAVRLSGGKATSVRTQINSLAKAGLISQVEHSGRGFKYTAAK